MKMPQVTFHGQMVGNALAIMLLQEKAGAYAEWKHFAGYCGLVDHSSAGPSEEGTRKEPG